MVISYRLEHQQIEEKVGVLTQPKEKRILTMISKKNRKFSCIKSQKIVIITLALHGMLSKMGCSKVPRGQRSLKLQCDQIGRKFAIWAHFYVLGYIFSEKYCTKFT
jgi:hypothetical protein